MERDEMKKRVKNTYTDTYTGPSDLETVQIWAAILRQAEDEGKTKNRSENLRPRPRVEVVVVDFVEAIIGVYLSTQTRRRRREDDGGVYLSVH